MTTADTLTKIVTDANARAAEIAPDDGGPITAANVTAKWDTLTPAEQAGFRRMGMGPKRKRNAGTKFVAAQVKKAGATAKNKPVFPADEVEQPREPRLTTKGNPRTTTWMDSSGKHDLVKGDQFKTKDGSVSGTIAGRHTGVKDGTRIPMICSDDPVYAKGSELASPNGRAAKSFRCAAADVIYVPPATPKPRAKKAAVQTTG